MHGQMAIYFFSIPASRNRKIAKITLVKAGISCSWAEWRLRNFYAVCFYASCMVFVLLISQILWLSIPQVLVSTVLFSFCYMTTWWVCVFFLFTIWFLLLVLFYSSSHKRFTVWSYWYCSSQDNSVLCDTSNSIPCILCLFWWFSCPILDWEDGHDG